MITVQDTLQLDVMKGMTLIAGKHGLSHELTKVSILDYEFTRTGAASAAPPIAGEFYLTSFLYAANDPRQILPAVKRLHKLKASGLAIRNVFHLDISDDVLRFANQYDFPIFIMGDHQCFFEDIIIEINRLQERTTNASFREERLSEILHGGYDKETIKRMALSINASFGHSYYCCYLRSTGNLGAQHLRQALNSKDLPKGSTLIRYHEGAFFIHTLDQSKGNDMNSRQNWMQHLSIPQQELRVGLSEAQQFLQNLRKALIQSYYAYLYAEVQGTSEALYEDMGIYQLLFSAVSRENTSAYLNRIQLPIQDIDDRTGSELWRTLLVFESCAGDIRKAAPQLHAHENTVRYRLRKIYEMFGKDLNDRNFETELFVAVKLHRMQQLLEDDPEFSLQ